MAVITAEGYAFLTQSEQGYTRVLTQEWNVIAVVEGSVIAPTSTPILPQWRRPQREVP